MTTVKAIEMIAELVEKLWEMAHNHTALIKGLRDICNEQHKQIKILAEKIERLERQLQVKGSDILHVTNKA